MRRIKVLEMIDRPFLGGGQAVLMALAGNLDRGTFEASVCAGGGGPLEEEVRRRGLAFHPARFGKTGGLRIVRDLARRFQSEGIDVLHTHGGVAGLYGRLAARRAGTRAVVHTLHGIHYLHYRNPALREIYVRLERRMSRRTSAVVCVSEADLARARRRRLAPGERLRLIRNGIADVGPVADADRTRSAREAGLRLDSGSPIVGTIARLHRQKGVFHLIRAAGLILQRRPDAVIVVAGGGPLEAKLRREANRLGLEGRVRILGERRDANTLLSLFDVFVLPSLWEGLPLALIEAAARGKTIVATDIEGSREIVRDGETGLLVPPGDPAALAAAVLRVLGDRDLARRLARRAQNEIPPAFTLGRMVEETSRLYLDCVDFEFQPPL